jgi:hypothetical protein
MRRSLLVEVRCKPRGHLMGRIWAEDGRLVLETETEHGPASLTPAARDRLQRTKGQTGQRAGSVDVVTIRLVDGQLALTACDRCGMPAVIAHGDLIAKARLAKVAASKQVMPVHLLEAHR